MTITLATDMRSIQCGGCGITFGMPERMYRERMEDQRSFWCPNGCCRRFTGESETQRLKRALNTTRRRAETLETQRDQAERSARACRGHLTRTKKRIGAGVCPCCNRHFKQLERHMKNQHPEYVSDTDHEPQQSA